MARSVRQAVRAFFGALLVATLTACGGPAGPGGIRAPGPPTPPVEDPGAVTPGEVTLRLRADEVRVGETLVAVVANGLAEPISTQDSKAGCSILHLDRREDGWVAVPGCLARRPPADVRIGPSLTRTVVIDTASDAFASGSPSGLGAGTYRLRLTYGVGPVAEGEENLTVVSAELEIG